MRDELGRQKRALLPYPVSPCERGRGREGAAAAAHLVCLFLTALITPAAVLAEITTDEITVHAPKEAPAQQQAPTAFVTSIETEEHAEELETVTDALAESVGVQVRRFGGLGAFSTISIRGSSSNQVQIYLDGIPLTRARNETVNLGDLPLDSLERVDVYRGTVPLSFGTAGLGGVVNLVTKEPGEEPESRLSASYGSFDTRKVVVSHSQNFRGVSFLAYATYLGSEGDFPFFVTDSNPNEESPHQHRENNSFDSIASTAKARYSLDPRTTIDLTTDFLFKSEGVVGNGGRQFQRTSFEEVRSTSYLRLSQFGLWRDRLDSNATVFGTFLNEQFSDPLRELGSSRQRRNDDTFQVGGNLGGSFRPIEITEISWFGEAALERFSGRDKARRAENEKDPNQQRIHMSIALQDETELFDRLTIVPTVRYEGLEDQGTEFSRMGMPTVPVRNEEGLWSYALGGALHLWEGLDLRANLARSQRAPSFVELYGHRGTVQGNPDLVPEDGISRDIGFIFRAPPFGPVQKLRLEYAYFNNDIDDIIVLETIPGPNPIRPKNVGAARVRGHEVSLAALLWERLELDCNYTNQNPENRDPEYRGNQLPGRPSSELYARAQFKEWRWRTYYEINLVGRSLPTIDNLRNRVHSRLIHTTGFRIQLYRWLSLGFEARNLGNDRAEDAYNYPLPGRSFFGTLEVRNGEEI